MEDITLRQSGGLREAAREWGPVVVLREMLRIRLAKFALTIIAITVIAAVFSPLLARHDPEKMDPMNNLSAPTGKFWIGSDRLGRDQLSRLIYGARISLIIGVASVALSVVAGVAIGTVAGFFGRWWDEVLMRFVDGLASIPGLLLALGLVAVTGGAVLNVILAIAITATPAKARLIRAQVLSIKERDYVMAARSIGAPNSRMILLHILPNSFAPIIVAATLSLGAAIIAEASLSFLGVGVKPPTPTWGGMLRHAFETVERAPWLTFTPGAAIFLLVLAFNFAGDALRDVLDPRLRNTR